MNQQPQQHQPPTQPPRAQTGALAPVFVVRVWMLLFVGLGASLVGAWAYDHVSVGKLGAVWLIGFRFDRPMVSEPSDPNAPSR